MFVCFLEQIVPLENFSLIWRRHFWWRASNFDLCSALMAIEQWGFFRVPRLLWHGASVYNGHLRGPVTLSPIETHFNVITKFYSKNINRNVEKTPIESTRFLYTKKPVHIFSIYITKHVHGSSHHNPNKFCCRRSIPCMTVPYIWWCL